MLRPLDPHRLDVLSREDDNDEGVEFLLHHHMQNVRKDVKEGGDWGHGVMGILHEGGDFVAFVQRTRPLTCEERKGSNEWFIDFYDFPFQDLSVRPSSGGVVDVCAHGKCIKSFQIIGCRKNWTAMVKWIWEYGQKIAMMKSKQEVQKKSRKSGRRVEKPLLHKVLHPARFKAQPERKTSVKDVAAASDNTDVIMDDLSTTTPSCNVFSDTASSSKPDDERAQNATTEDVDIRSSSKPDDERAQNATTEDVDISTLKVTDHGS